MPFFSPSQQSIYDAAKGFITQRLEQTLALSQSQPSKEALFFLLEVMQKHNTEAVRALIDTFYTEKHLIIKTFLMALNSWIKAEDSESRFIKSITDPRFRTNEQQSDEYTMFLKKEFGAHVAEDLKKWCAEKAPAHFHEKYPLLCIKYTNILDPHPQKAHSP